MKEVKFKLLREGAQMPTRVSDGSAGWDLVVPDDVVLKYGRQVVPMGLSVELPVGMSMDVRAKSGMSAKGLKVEFRGKAVSGELRVDADVVMGLVDSDYRGEVGVIIVCRSQRAATGKLVIPRGTAIAQACFHDVPAVHLSRVYDLSDSERGERGFGEMDETNS